MYFHDDEKKEILNIFKIESEETIKCINNLLFELRNSQNNDYLVLQLFYNVHSLKGLASAVGFNVLQELLHKLEDFLELIKNNKLKIDFQILNFLSEIFVFILKIINQFLNELENIDESSIKKYLSILEDIIDVKNNSKNDYVFDIDIKDIKEVEYLFDEKENLPKSSLKSLIPLFEKMVESSAEENKKLIKIVVFENSIIYEKNINKLIKNALIQIIRNSIAHGIELPVERQKLGKSPIGHIEICCKNINNNLVIEIEDDGQGFNIDKIKEKILSNGYCSEKELLILSKNAILNFALKSGFTTQEEASSFSGRGIGLDIVNFAVTQLDGNVQIFTEKNKGSKIKITLPYNG